MPRKSDVGFPAWDKKKSVIIVRERQRGCGKQGTTGREKSRASAEAVAADGSIVREEVVWRAVGSKQKAAETTKKGTEGELGAGGQEGATGSRWLRKVED